MRRRDVLLGGVASVAATAARAQCVTNGFNIQDCAGVVSVGPAPSLDLSLLAGPLDGRITFTRASTGTYFDATGTLQTATANTPRFDADPVTHAPRGLLIEEARTNLLLNSATLGTQSVTTTAVATTLSFYGTGTVALSGTFTGSLVGAGAFPARNALTFTPTAGTLTATVTGSVLDAQIEAGAFPTSYIPTTGATATRAADVATMPTGAWFNAAQGTIANEATLGPTGSVSRNASLPSFDNATAAETIDDYVAQNTGGTVTFAGRVRTGSVQVAFVSTTGLVAATPYKVAMTYTSSSILVTHQGQAAVSGANTALATVTRLQFGGSPQGGITPFNGWVSRVRYWPSALTAAQLQAITT